MKALILITTLLPGAITFSLSLPVLAAAATPGEKDGVHPMVGRTYKVTPDFRQRLARLLQIELPPRNAVRPLLERAGITFRVSSVMLNSADNVLYFRGTPEQQAKVALLVEKANKAARGR